MAIAYDTSGVVYSGTTTATVTLTAGASNELAMMYVWFNDSTASFSGITVGGSSTGVTIIGTSTDTSPDGNKLLMYRLVNPPTSSSDYVVTLSGTGDGMMWGVVLYSGVDQTSPIDSYAYVAGATTPFDFTTTVVGSNCWLSSFGKRYGGTDISFDSGTQRAKQAANFLVGDSNGTVSTGSQSLSYTTDATYAQGMIVSIAPVASGGPANLKSLDTNVKANIKSYNTNVLANIKSINTNA